MPLTNTIGKNTATEVSVEAVTAMATSRVPSRAASSADSPASRLRAIASRITTELSTSMPTDSAIPPSDMMLSVRSKLYISTKMPMTVTGMTMPVTTVARASRRKKYSTRIESNPPHSAASRTSPIALADESRLVVNGRELGVRRQQFLQCVEARMRGVRELHGVRVAFLVDGKLDAFAAVEASDGRAVLVASLEARDVPEIRQAGRSPWR